MKEIISHSQRAQTESRAAREPFNLNERLALSPRELGAAIGKSATYIYRQIYAGRLRPIADSGHMMISREEIDRFLARAVEYNPQPKSTGNKHGNGGEA